MKKIMLLGFLLLNSAAACAYGVFERTIFFVNCTNQDVQVTNTMDPYKFSLDVQPSGNGYSPRANFTVPKEATVYKYPVPLTGFYNSYTDGAMHVSFSGGVTGNVYFAQIDSGSRFVEVKITSSSSDIEFVPSLFVDAARYEPESLWVILGCGKNKSK